MCICKYAVVGNSTAYSREVKFLRIRSNSHKSYRAVGGILLVQKKNCCTRLMGSLCNCGPQCFACFFCMVDTPLLWTKMYTQLFDTNYDMVLWASIIPELSRYLPSIVLFLSHFVSVPHVTCWCSLNRASVHTARSDRNISFASFLLEFV